MVSLASHMTGCRIVASRVFNIKSFASNVAALPTMRLSLPCITQRECHQQHFDDGDRTEEGFMLQLPPVRFEMRRHPRTVLQRFLSRCLGMANPIGVPVDECWFTRRRSVKFKLRNNEDGSRIWKLYNGRRSQLAQHGIFLLNLQYPRQMNYVHRRASQLLLSMEKLGRTLQFREDGVCEKDGPLISTTYDLIVHFTPHRLIVFNLPEGRYWKETLPLFSIPSPRLMNVLCAELALPAPIRALSGLWHAFPLRAALDAHSDSFAVCLGSEQDKQLLVESFRKLVESESFPRGLRIVDTALPRSIRTVHVYACGFIPTFRKLGMKVRLTDSGVDVDERLYSSLPELKTVLSDHLAVVCGLPDPAEMSTTSQLATGMETNEQDGKLLDRLLHNGLRFPPNGSPVILGTQRTPVRAPGESRPMFLIFPTLQEKQKFLQAYENRRWWLWDRGIYIFDDAATGKVQRTQRLAMRRLSEVKGAAKTLCHFTEAGVVFANHLCESPEEFDHQLAWVSLDGGRRQQSG